MKTRSNRIFIYSLLTVVAILLALLIRRPESSYPEIPDSSKTDTLKAQARSFIQKSDSVKKQAVKNDSVRLGHLKKWREVKRSYSRHQEHDTVYVRYDSIVPVVINACDSVIFQDSVLMAKFKAIRQFDSLTIARQGKVIESDSLTIAGLKKEVKKHKRQKKLLTLLSVALGGVAVVK